jgi:AcrR family transcriptional regulator
MPGTKIKPAVPPPRPAGRPRSEESRAAILRAAYSFLQSRPVAAISTVHIAHKAGVSTATVYRWWSTKEALLLDAFLEMADPELTIPSRGTPLERLRAYVLSVGRLFSGKSGIVVARLLTAIQDNATLRREFSERVFDPREKAIRNLVKEAIAQRELPQEMEVGVFLDMMIGPLLARQLIRHKKLDEDYMRTAFDWAVAGATALHGTGRLISK